eukprot:15352170-Ditylum_brightwellii.AAC.1
MQMEAIIDVRVTNLDMESYMSRSVEKHKRKRRRRRFESVHRIVDRVLACKAYITLKKMAQPLAKK